MKKLTQIMEGFVASANNDGIYGSLSRGPVKVSPSTALPVVPMNRWFLEDRKRLRKRYSFRDIDTRNAFVSRLVEFEGEKRHYAEITIREDWVEIVLQTLHLEQVTELDKEYAKEADILYRDVMYVPEYEHKLAY